MSLYRAIYASRPHESLGPFDIVTILESSRRNNAAAGLTGVLFCNARAFLQVLEGPLSAINATYLRISADKRHHDVTMLRFGPISERQFPAWYMRSVDADEVRGTSLEQFDVEDFDDDDLEGLVEDLGGRASTRWLGDRRP